jgi:hypothetical protein
VPALRLAHRLLHRGAVGRACRAEPGLVRQPPEHHHVARQQVMRGAFVLPQPRQQARPFAAAPRARLASHEPDLAAVRQQARQRLEQGGLAGAVGAHHRRPAGGRQREPHAVQHLGAAARDVQPLGGDGHGDHAASSGR